MHVLCITLLYIAQTYRANQTQLSNNLKHDAQEARLAKPMYADSPGFIDSFDSFRNVIETISQAFFRAIALSTR